MEYLPCLITHIGGRSTSSPLLVKISVSILRPDALEYEDQVPRAARNSRSFFSGSNSWVLMAAGGKEDKWGKVGQLRLLEC